MCRSITPWTRVKPRARLTLCPVTLRYSVNLPTQTSIIPGRELSCAFCLFLNPFFYLILLSLPLFFSLFLCFSLSSSVFLSPSSSKEILLIKRSAYTKVVGIHTIQKLTVKKILGEGLLKFENDYHWSYPTKPFALDGFV